MGEIKLGDKVRCKITGFEGVAVAKSEFINGCIQFSVVPKISKKEPGLMPDPTEIDSHSLEVIPSKKKKIIKSETGGPNHRGRNVRGF